MLSLFARRVTLSAYRSGATYSRILPSSASALCDRRVLDTGLHTSLGRTFTNPRRNAGTNATATAKKTKSTTSGKTKPEKKLTPKQQEAQKKKAAALKAKQKARAEREKVQAEKEKERAKKEKQAAALKQKLHAEKMKRKAEAEKVIKPPPRRLSPFAVFVQDTRKPMKEVAAGWRSLSEEAKQEYVVRAKAAREERKEALDAFVKTITRSDLLRYNRSQKKKGMNRLNITIDKRPPGPFMKYMMDFRKRPDQAGKPIIEISKAASVAWRLLTEEEKDKYRNKSTESTTA